MDDIDIEDAFRSLGSVAIRRMFGGRGIYHRGLIVAVIFEGELLLKADQVSAPVFVAAGARQWSYEGRGSKAVLMPYWSAPDSAFDDPELMAVFVGYAYQAALRSSSLKLRKGPAGVRKQRASR